MYNERSLDIASYHTGCDPQVTTVRMHIYSIE